jgi:predicted  nucleic acid-binding Zn-ribbon protein
VAVTIPEALSKMESNQVDQAKVDLAEVARLVEALQRDLAQVKAGSGDLGSLRGEVEQLRVTLDSLNRDHDDVHEKLHGIRALLHKLEDELIGDALTAGDYLARIGRMLGM